MTTDWPRALKARATRRQSLGKGWSVEQKGPVAILRARLWQSRRKKTKTRRDKRRATHRLEAPRVNDVPATAASRSGRTASARTCKTYSGREVEPLRTPAP